MGVVAAAVSGGTVTVSDFSGGITNSGNITAGGYGMGVGGQLFNTPSATHPLVTILTFGGGITNTGTISAALAGIPIGGATPLGAQISDFSGGITNTGIISADFGIPVSDDLTFSGGIDNGGAITSGVTGIGVFYIEDFSGGVTNTGTVTGATGIDLTGTPGVQLFDSGTIIGTGGTAIEFDGPSDNTLTLAPGYSITGDVLGGGTDTLQLAGPGSGNFDLSDVGTQYTGFTTLDVVGGIWSATGTGSDWNVEGGTFEVSGSVTDTTVNSGGTLEILSDGAAIGYIDFEGVGGALRIDGTPAPGLLLGGTTLDDFKPGDTIDLSGIDYTTPTSAFVNGSDQLQITEGGKTYEIQLSGDFTGDTFHLAADNGGSGPGTEITETPCYCPGTLIGTGRGEQCVEQLKIGDEVMTASGALRPIKWIGRRSYSGRLAMGRKDILPVCIKAGALEDNVPKRDLWISPNHAMFLDGVLIEAKDLINGVSVLRAENVERVEYFHIELDSHDVIIAEGALAESFIDDDSRLLFHNANEYRVLYPDAAKEVAQYCAPRLQEGYEVEAVRRRIALRAGLDEAAAGWQFARLCRSHHREMRSRLGAECRSPGGAGLSRCPRWRES